jgi:hypothetical protein
MRPNKSEIAPIHVLLLVGLIGLIGLIELRGLIAGLKLKEEAVDSLIILPARPRNDIVDTIAININTFHVTSTRG